MTRVATELRALALDSSPARRGRLRAEAIRRRERSVRGAGTHHAPVEQNSSTSALHEWRVVSNWGLQRRLGKRRLPVSTRSPAPGHREPLGNTVRPCSHPPRAGIYPRSTSWLEAPQSLHWERRRPLETAELSERRQPRAGSAFSWFKGTPARRLHQ